MDLGPDCIETALSSIPWISLHPLQSNVYQTSFQADDRDMLGQTLSQRNQYCFNNCKIPLLHSLPPLLVAGQFWTCLDTITVHLGVFWDTCRMKVVNWSWQMRVHAFDTSVTTVNFWSWRLDSWIQNIPGTFKFRHKPVSNDDLGR